MVKSGKPNIDENPQFLNFAIVETAPGTFTQAEVLIPIPRFGDFRMVMEILKIYWEIQFDTLAEDATVSAHLCYRSRTAIAGLENPDSVMTVRKRLQLVTSGAIIDQTPSVIDMQDANGNGLLIACDKIYAGIISGGQGAAVTFRGKILYRFKKVAPEEYIGIVQSQV